MAVRASDGRIYTAISQMCDALGLDAQAQRRRMERHAILSKGVKGVANLATPGGIQSAYVLRTDLVPLWLSGVRVSGRQRRTARKANPLPRRGSQRPLGSVPGRATHQRGPILTICWQSDSEAVQAYKMLQAMMKLARNQILIEARLGAAYDPTYRPRTAPGRDRKHPGR